MGSRLGLLDDLGRKLHCLYLSELRKPSLASDLCRELRAIPAGRYPWSEWEDALHYLTGTQKAAPAPPKAVRARLLELLEAHCTESRPVAR